MNRRKLLGLGVIGTPTIAAPFVAAACVVMPRRNPDQVIDSSFQVRNGTIGCSAGGSAATVKTFIDALDYAIDATGVADSAPALNLAVQDAISQKKKLILPSGIFLLNSPLMCFIPGSAFDKVEIEGQGSGIPATLPSFPTGVNGIPDANTLLCANSKVLPAVIFQTNRNVVFSNMAIMGLNVAPFSVTEPNDVQANYVTSGCRTSQYSPYCAIAIDPFSTTSPPDGGYPGLTYNPVYSGGGTSGLILENVHIWGFVVGTALCTSGVNAAQGDIVTYKNVKVEYCDTAHVCGGTQARQWAIIDGMQNTCRQFIDTRTYGTQNARSPQLVQNFIFGGCYRVFNLGGSDVCAVVDCYSESVKTWGRFGPSGAISFSGCTVGIGTTAQGWSLMPPPYVFEASSPVVWKGCSFTTDSGLVYAWNFPVGSGNQSFEQCNFQGTDLTDVPPLIAVDYSSISGGHLKDCWIQSSVGSPFALSDDFTVRSYGVAAHAHNGRLRATWQTRFVQDANLTCIFQPPTSTNYVTAGATSLTMTGLTLTFAESVLGSVQLNDILLWRTLPQGFAGGNTVPCWKVTSVNAGTGACIATALFDVAQLDTVANNAIALGANVVAIVRHQWAPTQALTGTTATDKTLTSVSPTALLNGDFVQGSGIAAGTRVVSGGGTTSLVLNKATTASASGVTLYDGRLLIPTTTAAF